MRLTHIPTGIVVACQNERSQHQNQEKAWKMLRARMYEQELRKREAAARAHNDAKTDIGWGHQIRCYVLQPYQMVKDLRTGLQTSDTAAVLDGDIDEFIEAELAGKAFGGGPGAGRGCGVSRVLGTRLLFVRKHTFRIAVRTSVKGRFQTSRHVSAAPSSCFNSFDTRFTAARPSRSDGAS